MDNEEFWAMAAELSETKNKKSIQPIGYLKKEDGFSTWRDKLADAFKGTHVPNYILMEIHQPENEGEIKDWKSVPDDEVWAALQGMGWDINEQNPESTFDKLEDDLKTDNGKINFLLWKEMTKMDPRDYDDFLAFCVRLNYLRETLEESEIWRMGKNVATICALDAIERDYPDLYRRSIRNLRNKQFSWADFMVELKELAG